MKCYCCDVILSDYEATRRNAITSEFIDMCNKCYKSVCKVVLAVERDDLRHDVIEDEFEYESLDEIKLEKLLDI